MSQRTAIINSLITHISNSVSAPGYRGYRFLHEVNSFPSFYIAFQNESRTHRGRGTRLGIIAFNLRGYCWTDSLDSVEQYMRTIETAIQRYAPAHLRFVEEARVTSVRTDEGVMAPYGIVDMSIEVLYTVDPSFSQFRADSTTITADNNIIKVDAQ